MHHAIFSAEAQAEYPIVFLVPQLMTTEIQKEYMEPFGIPQTDAVALSLHYSQTAKKTPAKEMKQYIESELVPVLTDLKTQYIAVADGDYFKVLTKTAKIDVNLGYVMDCVFGPWKVVYVPNVKAIFYDPAKVRGKIAQGMRAMVDHILGKYVKPGSDIIKVEHYPESVADIKKWLDHLIEMDCDLSADIEGFSLRHTECGIGTIAFAWDKHSGVAFTVDYKPIPGATEAPYGIQEKNEAVRNLLRDFFKRFKRKMIWHNISFDVYVLIYQLFMDHVLDTPGMFKGMEHLLKEWDDTKLITYLATNSCAGNKLGLKDQAQEFAGNYAEAEIVDITKIPLPKLLRYNLVDALSTWFVHDKHYNTMVQDEQLEVYENLFKKATKDIIQMQLTGMPIDMVRVKQVKGILESIEKFALNIIHNSHIVGEFTHRMNVKWVEKRNATLKVKRVSLADANEVFNPNSGDQLRELLFEMLELPVISLTESKQASTDRESLEALVNHAKDEDTKIFIKSLLEYAAVNTLLKTFIPAMEDATKGPDGWHYLFGKFNLGGTVSGRLSSSDPNLQNLPSNVAMRLSEEILRLHGDLLKPFMKKGKLSLGKIIKYCFAAPPGWIFAGLDFASLEDRISALTTKDPNKLKVYTDGYDGHSMRAYSYFGDKMMGIDPLSVESINGIEIKYPELRQASKAPTFALTYAGTYKTLMKNCGFTEAEAKAIEAKYHELYKVSTQWVKAKLKEATRVGYVTVAFGLRVRTPMLHQVILGTSKTPYEAEAEGRTAGNALGQSWCLLNSRASVEFMEGVRESEFKYQIRPCAHIHDAQYFLIKDDIAAVMYTNKHLVKAVKWQDHPDIYHDEVKLGGELTLFYPDWAHEIDIPNDATQDDIFEIVRKAA